MPARRSHSRAVLAAAGSNEDISMLSDHERHGRPIRALPKNRIARPAKFRKYRNSASISEDESTECDESETENGTALSAIECDLQLYSRESTPFTDAATARHEGDLVDEVLYTSQSSSPAPDEDVYMSDGKSQDLYRRMLEAKRSRDDSDCDADDEEQVSMALGSKKRRKQPKRARLAQSNYGPTTSILEISSRLGETEITYSAMEEDDVFVEASADLASVPSSPTPGPSRPMNNLCLARPGRVGVRSNHMIPRGPSRRAPRQGAQLSRMRVVSSSSDDAMITSDIEQREIESIVDNSIVRREHLCNFPTRERSKEIKLRRTSPTSLLPMRETQRHWRHTRGKVYEKAAVGQQLLAAMAANREARNARRESMRKYYETRESALGQGPPHILSDITLRPYDVNAALAAHRRQMLNLTRRSLQRDQRRVAADRMTSSALAQPCRLPAPAITRSFAELLPAIESVESVEAELSDVDDLFSPPSPVSVVSEPPEYEPPMPPVHITLPPHLRPRARTPPPSNVVPSYGWLAENRGGQYHRRRTPSPPPPFNAQTDCQTIIAPYFIDDEEDEEEEALLPVRPIRRASPVEIIPDEDVSDEDLFEEDIDDEGFDVAPPSPMLAAAQPEFRDLLPPVEIFAPTPVHARSSFEAALDMEEGDQADEVLGGEAVQAPQPRNSSRLDGLLGLFPWFRRG